MKVKAHQLVFLCILILLAVSYWKRESGLDIQLHDTYFVFDLFFIGIFFSSYLLIIGISYYLFKDNLTSWMTILHLVITLGGIFLLLYFLVYGNASKYLRVSSPEDLETLQALVWGILFGVCIWGLAQILLLINLFRPPAQPTNGKLK